jgi:CBS domain-containing protein
MQRILEPPTVHELPLEGKTAADLMTSNPVSVRDAATVRELVALLTDKGISAAPVINEAGHPIGVVSRADVLTYDREKVEYVRPLPEYYDRSDLATDAGEKLGPGFQVERAEDGLVVDIMTPVVFSVGPGTPAAEVVRDMVALKVHRLFVVDADGVLVGVISALDVLRHLI